MHGNSTRQVVGSPGPYLAMATGAKKTGRDAVCWYAARGMGSPTEKPSPSLKSLPPGRPPPFVLCVPD